MEPFYTALISRRAFKHLRLGHQNAEVCLCYGGLMRAYSNGPTDFDPEISREKRRVIRAAIKLIKKRMKGKNPTVSTGELIRLMNTEDGMQNETPQRVDVRWVDPPDEEPCQP